MAGLAAFNLKQWIEDNRALLQPPVLLVSVLSAYLLWEGRKKFLGLLN